jgi:hypothetical protein
MDLRISGQGGRNEWIGQNAEYYITRLRDLENIRRTSNWVTLEVELVAEESIEYSP